MTPDSPEDTKLAPVQRLAISRLRRSGGRKSGEPLQEAKGGEIVMSDRVARGLPAPVGTGVELTLTGEAEPQHAYRVNVAP